MSTPQDQNLAMAISESTDETTDCNRLSSAKAKLALHGFDVGSLPTVRTEALWGRIETECDLNLDEISALKNDACLERSRGLLPFRAMAPSTKSTMSAFVLDF